MNIPTDYEMELRRIDKEISALEENMSTGPIDAGTTTRLLYYMFHRASLTGKFAEFKVTETAINNALRQVGPWPDLCLLKANLDFKASRHDIRGRGPEWRGQTIIDRSRRDKPAARGLSCTPLTTAMLSLDSAEHATNPKVLYAKLVD